MPIVERAAPLLLASVRDIEEADVALSGGADVLDIKDPGAGPLGACPEPVLRAIVLLRDRRSSDGPSVIPVSAALGDAGDLPGTLPERAAATAACGVDYLKVGLRGLQHETEYIDLLRAVVLAARRGMPGSRVVAAAYAEAGTVGSPTPEALPLIAERAGAAGCMIDTAIKNGRTLLDHIEARSLSSFISAARNRHLLCALAGSLTPGQIPMVAELGPDLIGLRGALCEGGRLGRLDRQRLASVRGVLRRRAEPRL